MSINNKTVIDYCQLVDEAMYFLVYKALKIVEQHGLIGDHHFMITFFTKHPEVILSKKLHNQYPDKMMIVLQYQFSGLVVNARYFEVILNFKGIPEKIVIPFAAITTFTDPSVQFCLEFSVQTGFDQIFKTNNEAKSKDSLNIAFTMQHSAHVDEHGVSNTNLGVNNNSNNIVSLRDFRHKRNKIIK